MGYQERMEQDVLRPPLALCWPKGYTVSVLGVTLLALCASMNRPGLRFEKLCTTCLLFVVSTVVVMIGPILFPPWLEQRRCIRPVVWQLQNHHLLSQYVDEG